MTAYIFKENLILTICYRMSKINILKKGIKYPSIFCNASSYGF